MNVLRACHDSGSWSPTSLQRPNFMPGSVQVGCVVCKVALGEVSLLVLRSISLCHGSPWMKDRPFAGCSPETESHPSIWTTTWMYYTHKLSWEMPSWLPLSLSCHVKSTQADITKKHWQCTPLSLIISISLLWNTLLNLLVLELAIVHTSLHTIL